MFGHQLFKVLHGYNFRLLSFLLGLENPYVSKSCLLFMSFRTFDNYFGVQMFSQVFSTDEIDGNFTSTITVVSITGIETVASFAVSSSRDVSSEQGRGYFLIDD